MSPTMILRTRHNRFSLNIWPCFVDALSSLLMLIVFAMIGAFISQVYLSTMLNDSDSSLRNLQNKYSSLQSQAHLKSEEARRLLAELETANALLGAAQARENTLQTQSGKLNRQIQDLTSKLEALNALLESERQAAATTSRRNQAERNRLEGLLDDKILALNALQQELTLLKEQIPPSILRNPELLKYRSEFFGTLQDILGGRSDIRPVGDRFVFQSEVLFDQGSAELGANGRAVLDTLSTILIDLSRKIPPQINWVLRVDGHTDRLPIHNGTFASNWELSSARAVTVVKYLISKGISPKHLAATGFAEHCPLTDDPQKMAKNRRIEFRFDQQ